MKNFYLIIIFIFIWVISYAQDAQLSIFTTSPLAINPATTGGFQNDNWRLYADYKSQWKFLNQGISNNDFSFDMPVFRRKVGLGCLISNSIASNGGISTLSFVSSFGYSIRLTRRVKQYLSFGLQAGIRQVNFNPDKLFFANQYIPGVGFDPNQNNGENFTKTSTIYPDFNFGIMWYIKDKGTNFKPWAGASVYHITEPNESFHKSMESNLARKYIIYSGVEIIMSDYFNVSPMLLLLSQYDFTRFSAGGYLSFSQSDQTTFYLGAYYRNDGAIVSMVGLDLFQGFTISFDYETNISYLKNVNNGNGDFAISLRYINILKRRYNVRFRR
jgi:type IX secretion system PorP/SprF family membrane protein